MNPYLPTDLPPAHLLLRKMRDAGILDEVYSASGRRAAVLRFSQLLHVAEGRDAL